MNGKAGNNQIWDGTGNDSLRDNSGDDFVYAGAGNDIVYGGIGNDACYGDAGTDTVKGEVGDDIIKGGTGISFVNGGDGDDTLYCDPTTSSIAAVQTYLSESILDGDGGGTDTLNIFSYATYTASGATKATTEIVMSRFTSGHIFFTDPLNFAQSYVGDLQEVDKLTVAGGAAKLEFTGSWNTDKEYDITSTAGNDMFNSFAASDTMRGDSGNDDFYSYGGVGNDVMVSATNDADRFYFDASTVTRSD